MMSTICNHWLPNKCDDQGPVEDQCKDVKLTLDTIRQRVRKIKGSWSPEERKLRRIEGNLRRANLEKLLFDN